MLGGLVKTQQCNGSDKNYRVESYIARSGQSNRRQLRFTLACVLDAQSCEKCSENRSWSPEAYQKGEGIVQVTFSVSPRSINRGKCTHIAAMDRGSQARFALGEIYWADVDAAAEAAISNRQSAMPKSSMVYIEMLTSSLRRGSLGRTKEKLGRRSGAWIIVALTNGITKLNGAY